MKVYSFPRGGITFDDDTAPSRTGGSVLSFLPDVSVVPLTQQNGVHSLPVVAAGDTVREGQLIARRQGAGSANIHSPVPGKIVSNVTWRIARSILCNSMVIRMEGSFSISGKKEETYRWQEQSPFELRELITGYGIVAMNGTGAPLTDTISLYHKTQKPVTLVLCCVFDDPWLVANYVLCQERTEEVAAGAFITARAAQAQRIVIAVSAPEKDLGFMLLGLMNLQINTEAAAENPLPPVEVVLVGSRYPQRNERELEMVLRQCEKKEKKDFGAMLFVDPATSAAVSDAVTLRKPVLDRYIAVGGSAVRHPKVLRARIGSRLSQLFRECGGLVTRPKRTAIGPPLLGRPVVGLDEPVSAATYAIIAVCDENPGFHSNPAILDLRTTTRMGLEKDEDSPFKHGYAQAKSCISCGECRAVCPVGLDPEDLYKMFAIKKFSKVMIKLSLRCHGCGCCEVVCPSRLPLSRLIINPLGGGN